MNKSVNAIIEKIKKLDDVSKAELVSELLSITDGLKAPKATKAPYDILSLKVVPYSEKSYIVLGDCKKQSDLFRLLSPNGSPYKQTRTIDGEKRSVWTISRTKYDRLNVPKIIEDLRTSDDWERTLKNKVSYLKGLETKRNNRKTA